MSSRRDPALHPFKSGPSRSLSSPWWLMLGRASFQVIEHRWPVSTAKIEKR